MKGMIKKLMVVLVSAFLFMGTVFTPVEAKGSNTSGTNGWNPWGWFWGWGYPQPTQPTPAPAEEPVVEEEPVIEEDPVTEPVVEEEPIVDETPEIVEEPVVEETPEVIYAPISVAEMAVEGSNDLLVSIDAPAEAFPAGTEVFAKVVPNEEVQGIIDASENVDGTVLAAVDITFMLGEEEMQPANDQTVNVSITAKNLIADTESLDVVHIDSETEEAESTGMITVDTEEETVSFDAESFSVYAIVWTVGDVEQKAYIHWGIDEEGGFKDLATPTTIDSTASSVDINIIIDAEKYYFIGADYRLSEDAVEFENLKSTVLHKVDGVWQVSLDSGTVQLANESHIYVHYAQYTDADPYVAPEKPGPEILAPDTEKTVTNNGDGTYTIRLDVEGKAEHSTTRIGANVVVVMDITQSMTNSMSGGGTRMAAAKSALNILINALDPDTNLINFRAINFGDNAQPYDYNSNPNRKRGVNWTTQKSAMQAYANGLSDNPDDMGTCWQAGLRGGYNIVNTEVANNADLKKNETYVVFVTDGNPNCYAQNNDGSGTWHGASGPNYNATAYNRAAYWANLLGPSCHFYGVYCGNSNDDGLGYLRNLITAANGGNNANFINGTSRDAIESAFNDIAQTVVNNLGAGGVTVDDGIPSLSNVSANVSAGEAGGFKYYIKPAGGTETEWTEGATGPNDPGAPGATYSQTNGVTWDLGETGELQNGWIYSLEFTVWPSQAAYDLIADLNNGLRTLDELTEEQRNSIEGNITDGYTLKTNTHLYTTFVDLDGNEFRDVNDAKAKAMDLPTETISVEKLWHNFLDSRTDTDIDGLQLVLSRDGEEYLEFDVSAPDWKEEGIYISCGQIASGVIKEKGHDYYVTEKAAETVDKTAYWEVNSPVYHPMVVDGTMELFIEDDDAASPEFSIDYENEDGTITTHKYVKPSGDTGTKLTAINERVSWLNLTKVVEGENAPEDTLFEYKVTITEPVEGNEVYFSVRSSDVAYRDDVETDAEKYVDETTGNTYYIATSGTEFSLKIKADWNVRFLNLDTGTTYTIKEQEETMAEGFVFDSAQTVETLKIEGGAAAQGYPITTTQSNPTDNGAVVTGSTVSGTINQTNTDYSVTYTNKYLGYFYVYHSSDNTIERHPIAVDGEIVYTTDNPFDIVAAAMTKEDILYGGYYHGYAGAIATDEQINGTAASDTIEYDEDGNAQDKEGATPYSYEYIKNENKAVWNDETAYTDAGTDLVPETNAVYYLKEVPNKYLLPYTHYTYNKSDKLLRNMWYISATDDLRYGEAGFFVKTIDADGKESGTFVDTLTVKNATGGATVKLTPKSVFGNKGGAGQGVQAGYLTYWDASSLIKANTTSVFTPYWKTPDGIYVLGTDTRTVAFNNGKVGSGGMRITDAANSTPFAELN